MDQSHATVHQQALSVSELNRQVRHLLEVSFLQVYVEGELSNFARPSSGHWYFALKDSKAQVKCAMFRNRNQSVRTLPKEGDQVLLRAKVSLYESRGDFQLIVESIEPAGLGALQRAFDALKARLESEGLFAVERKRPIPALPRRIGVVTSPTGAAIHDILTVLKRRFPAIPVTLYPTPVQGQEASAAIARAIESANRHNQCDVLIVGRGGGSLEDLWPFNEEVVARAIAASQIPVVSAVGHEVDVTIADFVADQRAPTPSAAAEKVVPDGQQWLSQWQRLEERLILAARRQLAREQQRVEQLATRLRDPRRELEEKAQRLDELDGRLTSAWNGVFRDRQTRLQHLQDRLRMQSPQSLIARHMERIAAAHHQLARALDQHLKSLDARFRATAEKLDLVSPLATLNRGYAIVGTDKSPVLRRASEVAPGDRIRARLAEGELHCTVDKTEPE
ncbi:exodeoxyribonuclease VII large subunit [Marinobacteraceae bacterium S3BR75-40.1]